MLLHKKKVMLKWPGNLKTTGYRNSYHRLPPFELWVRELTPAPKTVQAIAITLNYPLELDRNLLLKTSHTFITSHRNIKLELSRKLPFCWLDFTMCKGTIWACGGETSSIFELLHQPTGKICPGSIM